MEDDANLIWKEEKRTELLKTPVFTVTERHNKGPQGIEGDYIVNEARDWAIVIAEHENMFLMVKQWRHGEKALSIEFPGGVIEYGEKAEEAARRELLEETGASADTFVHLGSMNPNPALFANHVHFFYASNLYFSGKQHLDKDEFVNCISMKKEDVYNLVGTASFPHALMASALALYLIKRA
ncbi:MAG TPA: NUDIX hydrolase [Treponema sp.]|nr:NUDIX hydrolase [Treponema sp.]